MEKDKKRIGRALLEELGELVLTLVFLGIGLLVATLFGVDFKSPDTDYDLIVLVGVGVFLVVFVIIWALVQCIKKISKKKVDEIIPIQKAPQVLQNDGEDSL